MFIGLRTSLLILAGAISLGACPAAVPSVDGLSFSCRTSHQCAPGYQCSRGACVSALSDSAVVDAGDGGRDRGAVDALSEDRGVLDRGPLDRSPEDLESTELAPPDLAAHDRNAEDHAVLDAVPRDSAGPDNRAPDSTSGDRAAPDQASPDQASPDQASPDQASPDQASPDAAAGDSGDQDPWAAQGWTRRVRIDLDNSGLEHAVHDFPLLLRIPVFIQSEPVSSAPGGADLRFTTAAGVRLPHEIERWSGEARPLVWVGVGEIPPAGEEVYIWMYTGKADAVDDQDPGAVWHDDYVGVWHLHDDLLDSTANGCDATSHNVQRGLGRIGGGIDIDDSRDQYLSVDNLTALNSVNDQVTISAWVQRQSAQSGWATVAARYTGTADDDHYLIGFHDNAYVFYVTTDEGEHIHQTATSSAPLQQWLWFCATYDGATMQIYVDGDPLDDGAHSMSGGFPDTSTVLHVGADSDNQGQSFDFQVDGLIDEVRLSRVARTAGWIQLQHRAMDVGIASFGVPVVL